MNKFIDRIKKDIRYYARGVDEPRLVFIQLEDPDVPSPKAEHGDWMAASYSADGMHEWCAIVPDAKATLLRLRHDENDITVMRINEIINCIDGITRDIHSTNLDIIRTATGIYNLRLDDNEGFIFE